MEDIKRVKLSEIVELITKGTTPTTLGYEFQDEGVNFLKIECFDENGGFIESKVAHISEECHKKMKRSQLKNGDILFSIAGAIGRVAIVTEEMLPANINQALAIIRISDEQVYLPYIKLILTSPIVIEQFERKKQGVAQLNLSLKDINEISIPLPSKDKQIELAELFDKVVGVISKRNKELSALDDLIKARFVEMFGDPVLNEKGWKTKPLLDMGKCKNGMNFHYDDSGVEINCLGVGDFKDLSVIDNTEQLPTVSLNEMPSEEYLLKDDDIVFVRSNGNKALVGRSVAVYPGDIPTTFSGFCIRYRKYDNAVTIPYLLRVLKADSIRKKMAGRGANIQNLNQQILGTLVIPVPPIELQMEFSDFVKQVDKSKVVVQKALDETQILFNSLMQQYFG